MGLKLYPLTVITSTALLHPDSLTSSAYFPCLIACALHAHTNRTIAANHVCYTAHYTAATTSSTTTPAHNTCCRLQLRERRSGGRLLRLLLQQAVARQVLRLVLLVCRGV